MSAFYRAEEVVQTDVGQFINDAGLGLLLFFVFVFAPVVLWANFGPTSKEESAMASGCECTNHKGNRKVQHRDNPAALKAALKQARAGRPARVYRCPTSPRWHVTTKAEMGGNR